MGESVTQIKTRDRVRDLAEVYTAKEQVDAMLDLVASECRHLDSTFLEPACGNGNFLAEILRRKLRGMHKPKSVTGLGLFEFRTLRALASIYGIDIDPSNVSESRDRMKGLLREHYSSKANSMRVSEEFTAAADEILRTNVILGDTLAGASDITIVEYAPVIESFGFVRAFHNFDDLKNPDRLLIAEPYRVPVVHYSALGSVTRELGEAA